MHTFKQDEHEQERSFSSNPLIPVQVAGDQSLSLQLRTQGRHQPWTGYPSIAEHTHVHSHTQTGTVETRQFTSRAHRCDVGGNLRPGENPHRKGRTYRLHTQWPQLGIDFFFSLQCYDDTSLKTMLFSDFIFFEHTCILNQWFVYPYKRNIFTVKIISFIQWNEWKS